MTKLEEKKKELADLTKRIELRAGKVLDREKKQGVENEQFKLEFALKNLLDECRVKETELKITAFENILKILDQ